MQSNGRIALLAYNSLAALAGGAMMLVLVRSAMLEPTRLDSRETARDTARTAAQLPRTDRMAYATPGALSSRSRLPAVDPQLRPSITAGGEPATTDGDTSDESAGAPDWATETHSEARPAQPQSRFSVLPSLRLPWQTAKPAGAPRRPYTLKERLAEISPAATLRLAAKFEAAKIAWPPAEIALVAIKDERSLEMHARGTGGTWKLVHRYRVLAASGGTGPKLRQGDRQVPEGVYGIASLNPNSAYHVSLRVNYPNAFDRQMAAKEGRKDLGGDIMIHGKNLSAGCLAIGDEAAEEVFVTAAQVGLGNVKLVIAPTDFRQAAGPAAQQPGNPDWVPKLYSEIASAMTEFKAPPKSRSLLSFFQ